METTLKKSSYDDLKYKYTLYLEDDPEYIVQISDCTFNKSLGAGFDIAPSMGSYNISFSIPSDVARFYEGDCVTLQVTHSENSYSTILDYMGNFYLQRPNESGNIISYTGYDYMTKYDIAFPDKYNPQLNAEITPTTILNAKELLVEIQQTYNLPVLPNNLLDIAKNCYFFPYYYNLSNISVRFFISQIKLFYTTNSTLSVKKIDKSDFILSESISSDTSYIKIDYIKFKTKAIVGTTRLYPQVALTDGTEILTPMPKSTTEATYLEIRINSESVGYYAEDGTLLSGTDITGDNFIEYNTDLSFSGGSGFNLVYSRTIQMLLNDEQPESAEDVDRLNWVDGKVSYTWYRYDVPYLINSLKNRLLNIKDVEIKQASFDCVGNFSFNLQDLVQVYEDGVLLFTTFITTITNSFDGGLKTSISSGTLSDSITTSSSGTSTIVQSGISGGNSARILDMDNAIKLLQNKVEKMDSDFIKTGDLSKELAVIKNLTLNSSFIKNIQSESITTDFLKAESANVDWATILNATITDAMIDTISADKILSGTLYTNNVNIQSENGGILISDNTQQFKDAAGNVRMQIGQDADGNFNYSIFGPDGKTAIFDENGIRTEDAIPDKLIKDIKIADDANISAGKLDIASLFKVINEDGTHTLNSSKILYDETNSTLDVVMSQMTSNIESLTNVAYGQVMTYNVDEIPTLNNYPAYDWIAPIYPSKTLYPDEDLIFAYSYDEYRKHLGSVCYLKDSTDSYRFCMSEEGTFYWKLIEDSETAIINTKISKLEMTTDGLNSTVGEMQQTISGQQATVDEMSSSIEQNKDSISLCVLKTTYDNGMAGKVSTKSIISSINQSAEEIKISADKLTLDGLVTVKGLENGTTSIDGSCINTGKISVSTSKKEDTFIEIKCGNYINSLFPSGSQLHYQDMENMESFLLSGNAIHYTKFKSSDMSCISYYELNSNGLYFGGYSNDEYGFCYGRNGIYNTKNRRKIMTNPIIEEGTVEYNKTKHIANPYYFMSNHFYILFCWSWTTANSFGMYAFMTTHGQYVTTIAKADGVNVELDYPSSATIPVVHLKNTNANGTLHYRLIEMEF